MEEHSNSVTSGLVWKFAERIVAQGVSFVLSMILARILMPNDYGVVAILLIFITIANVFVAQGFSTALIQKKDADEIDFSTMFYCSLLCSILLYIVLFALAPVIAEIYRNPLLIPTLRVLALKLPIAAVNSIQHAYVSRHMIFKKFFYSTLIGTIISAFVGIWMAINGFGAWALVVQYLTNSLIDTIVLFFSVPWTPHLLFSFERAKSLMTYGWKVTAAELVSTGYTQIRSLVIGKMYTSADLAFYNKGEQFPSMLVNNINSSIATVLLPAMAKRQSSKVELKNLTKKSMRISAYIIFPMMGLLAMVSPKLIVLILTEKWKFCVPYLQLACITYALMPLSTSNLQAVKAMGRSDLFLKMEIIKKSVGIILVLFSMRYGTIAIAVSAVLASVFNNIVNIYPNKKLLDYGYKEQIYDLMPSILLTIVICLIVYPLGNLRFSNLSIIIIQCLVGGSAYVICSKVFRNKEFDFLVTKIEALVHRKNKSA